MSFLSSGRGAASTRRRTNGFGAGGSLDIRQGVEVAQEVLAEAQGAVLPLVPHLDSLRWIFITLALAGIAVAIWARVDDWRRGMR